MDIVTVPFAHKVVLKIKGQLVSLIALKTRDPGAVKLGVVAPKEVMVRKEEAQALSKKENNVITNPLA
ncbi:hypothetical protein [Legionella fairfieldensis]|uniref:hypothetical protein n=1 Tax=Legionella fairfieldensis TaxID=45064 RepID=UPI00056A54D5|nr:hypothetical protein [Legionella fairfieldensis]